MFDSRERPISVAILAVGGQGGGVLTKWLVDTAEANGYIAQSTFVAGVAQRTGATVYCVEMFPRDRAEAIGREPVFTPYPVPGDVDLVVVGEMAETGRAIQKGFVTPNITTLISSTHRIYSIAEKEALGDGIMDQSPVARAAEKASKKFINFDMDAAADETGSAISSILLGAIANVGALPFDRDAYEATIRNSGRAVEANLKGFAAGYDRAGQESAPADAEMPAAQPGGANGEALKARIESELPSEIRNMALHGALRALDYQDPAYATLYLNRLDHVFLVDSANVALQMCYEDTIRVADLKTRGERITRIRQHVAAAPEQPAHVVEYFHPRLEEICDTLPVWLGSMILRSAILRKILAPFFRSGRNIKTTNISGFLVLHMLAKFRRWRRGTYRFKVQETLISDWADRVCEAALEDYDYALAIAHCIEMVKGYGDTYQRGLTRYRAAVDAAGALPTAKRATAMRRLHKAAMVDEEGKAFGDALSTLEAVH